MNENKKLNVIEKLALLAGLVVITAFSFVNNKNETSPAPTPAPVAAKQIIGDKSSDVMAKDRDTLPKGASRKKTINFRHISSNINNSENSSVYEVDATDDQGNTYKVKKLNGELTSFELNGTEMQKENHEQYLPIINAIEAARTDRGKQIGFRPEKRKAITGNSKSIFTKKDNKSLFGKSGRKSVTEKRGSLTGRKKTGEKSRLFSSKPKQLKSNSYIENIVNDLVGKKLLDNTNSFSFTLNIETLVVNGQPQPANVHDQFKQKYVKNPKDHFIYSYADGTTRANIFVE